MNDGIYCIFESMAEEQKQWFKSWFDTEEYHELYGHRDHNEAARFIKKLCAELTIPIASFCIDLASGKGRHSNTLAELGMNILGLDLSENSVSYAKSNAHKNASFQVHDMRNPLPVKEVDYIFNLFTSFGYFAEEETDAQIVQHQYNALKSGGMFIQDYLNAGPVVGQLPQKELIEKPGNTYHIRKYLAAGNINKEIRFGQGDDARTYTEQVKIYSLEKLKHLHEEAGFEVQHIFGDYELTSFNPSTSKRIIIISKKC